MTLRSHLITLVLVAVLPLLVFSAIVLALAADSERDATERGLRATGRAVGTAVDHALDNVISALEVLATSGLLDAGDLPGFRGVAVRALEGQHGWLSVSVVDSEGRQVLNTLRPTGTDLPPPADAATVAAVLARRVPVVSDLISGDLPDRAHVVVAVPVLRDGSLRGALLTALDATTLAHVLEAQQLPRAWAAGIVDGRGVVVARSPDAQRFTGRPATPEYVAFTARRRTGAARSRPSARSSWRARRRRASARRCSRKPAACSPRHSITRPRSSGWRGCSCPPSRTSAWSTSWATTARSVASPPRTPTPPRTRPRASWRAASRPTAVAIIPWRARCAADAPSWPARSPPTRWRPSRPIPRTASWPTPWPTRRTWWCRSPRASARSARSRSSPPARAAATRRRTCRSRRTSRGARRWPSTPRACIARARRGCGRPRRRPRSAASSTRRSIRRSSAAGSPSPCARCSASAPRSSTRWIRPRSR